LISIQIFKQPLASFPFVMRALVAASPSSGRVTSQDVDGQDEPAYDEVFSRRIIRPSFANEEIRAPRKRTVRFGRAVP
jgi:hypothetical protein